MLTSQAGTPVTKAVSANLALEQPEPSNDVARAGLIAPMVCVFTALDTIQSAATLLSEITLIEPARPDMLLMVPDHSVASTPSAGVKAYPLEDTASTTVPEEFFKAKPLRLPD